MVRCGIYICREGRDGPRICLYLARSLAPFHPVVRHSKNIPLHLWPRPPFIVCCLPLCFHPRLQLFATTAYSLPTTVDVISRRRNHNSLLAQTRNTFFCFHHNYTSPVHLSPYVRTPHPASSILSAVSSLLSSSINKSLFPTLFFAADRWPFLATYPELDKKHEHRRPTSIAYSPSSRLRPAETRNIS